MHVSEGSWVCLPRFAPYPRYGLVVRQVDDEHVLVSNVQCGDPRCASEHEHADAIWPVTELEAAHAYQGRAAWEEGRLNSPNPVLFDEAA